MQFFATVLALAAVAAAAPASDATDSKSCQPGTFICNKNEDAILVCDVNKQFVLQAACGGGTPICQVILGVPHCVAPETGNIDHSQEPCRPGAFTCNKDDTAIQVCGVDGVFTLQASCGGPTPVCRIDDEDQLPHCFPN